MFFRYFENLLDPYPEGEPENPPSKFFPFLYACTKGLRRYLLLMTACTAIIGVFEAMLFAMLGSVVD